VVKVIRFLFLLLLLSLNVNAQEDDEEYYYDYDFTGFIETRVGARTRSQNLHNRASIEEIRFSGKFDYENDYFTSRISADLIYDHIDRNKTFDIEKGDGPLDLREFNFIFRPTSFMDIKAGRQILTNGVSDFIFINDLYPKDWRAFFIGRDDNYLKAPSDALKVSLFSSYINLDIVFIPRHDASRFINGSRLSYYSPIKRSFSGSQINPIERNTWGRDAEYSFRLYKTISSTEVALYYFNGYWKTPEGINQNMQYYFPNLNSYGLSVRTPAFSGIFSFEFAYYDSSEDRPGNNPFVRNSEARVLAGYEKEVFKNFTAAYQIYFEDAINSQLLRIVNTIRLTYFALKQNLKLSFFMFHSPNDDDLYLMPRVSYNITDGWKAELGANIFSGDKISSFLGQFMLNSNIYASVRYSF
jgi:hypothetical protein